MRAILASVSKKSKSKDKTCHIFEAQLGKVKEAELLFLLLFLMKSQLKSHSYQL